MIYHFKSPPKPGIQTELFCGHFISIVSTVYDVLQMLVLIEWTLFSSGSPDSIGSHKQNHRGVFAQRGQQFWLCHERYVDEHLFSCVVVVLENDVAGGCSFGLPKGAFTRTGAGLVLWWSLTSGPGVPLTGMKRSYSRRGCFRCMLCCIWFFKTSSFYDKLYNWLMLMSNSIWKNTACNLVVR